MAIEKLHSFKIRLYSKDGKTSPVSEYILELVKTNKLFAWEAIAQISKIPEIMYLGLSDK
ncbi:MAG: hypothetical protein WCK98_04945 [bacterium]